MSEPCQDSDCIENASCKVKATIVGRWKPVAYCTAHGVATVRDLIEVNIGSTIKIIEEAE